jgi:hypothetical protein
MVEYCVDWLENGEPMHVVFSSLGAAEMYSCAIRGKENIEWVEVSEEETIDLDELEDMWKSHSTLTLLATQDLPTFLYYMIDPLKSWCWGAILFYPFKNSRFS